MKRIALLLVVAVLLALFAPMAALAADVDFPRINLQGDTAWMPRTGQVAICAGTTLATFYDELIELRGEACPAVDNRPAMYGAAASISINQALLKFGATIPAFVTSWKSAIGIGALGDFNNSKIEPAVILTLIKVTF